MTRQQMYCYLKQQRKLCQEKKVKKLLENNIIKQR